MYQRILTLKMPTQSSCIIKQRVMKKFGAMILHPSILVQSRKLYPVGHPKIMFKDFDSVDNYFGFV